MPEPNQVTILTSSGDAQGAHSARSNRSRSHCHRHSRWRSERSRSRQPLFSKAASQWSDCLTAIKQAGCVSQTDAAKAKREVIKVLYVLTTYISPRYTDYVLVAIPDEAPLTRITRYGIPLRYLL